jgi:hypothetical protein
MTCLRRIALFLLLLTVPFQAALSRAGDDLFRPPRSAER